jgi:hypothetical protein
MKCTLATWQKTLKNPRDFILQASTVDEWDGWQTFPIGMSFRWTDFESKWNENQIGEHIHTLLLAITPGSDKLRRPRPKNRNSILQTLLLKGFRNIQMTNEEYFSRLRNFKFVVSPEGNGIDCHRTYEALMAGCIPIVEDRPEMRKKYEGCPILWTTDYKEINSLYLLGKYEKMLHTQYDFSRLFYSSYSKEEQEKIRICSEHWMKKTRPNFPTFYESSAPFVSSAEPCETSS